MKTLLLTTAFMLTATPVLAANITIKEVTDYNAKKPHFFSPDKVTIQPGDTVTFVNAQDEMHEVMFVNVPKGVDEMIMSPMHEKKGDSFSYTFTVPGTYKFHCHPHESLGMEGTLIVGQASKPGETKAMDHHKLSKKLESSDATATNTPQGTGKVISVDAANNSIKIDHDPIKALGWPKMKMVFTADKNIDLSRYKAGDAVTFTLKPAGKDDYVIVDVKKR